MVKPSCVRLYIEGGAEGRTADNDFRRGWKKFLMELHILAREKGFNSLEVVRGKSRANTFERFSKYNKEFPSDLCVMLVDSETTVPEGRKVWDTVQLREGDHWVKPNWATERHLYLMVPFVEAWILTDHQALSQFFGAGFDAAKLPKTNIDKLSKGRIEKELEKATKNSSKGQYRHGQAHEVLEIVLPERVKTLYDGRRLFEELSKLIQEKAQR